MESGSNTAAFSVAENISGFRSDEKPKVLLVWAALQVGIVEDAAFLKQWCIKSHARVLTSLAESPTSRHTITRVVIIGGHRAKQFPGIAMGSGAAVDDDRSHPELAVACLFCADPRASRGFSVGI